MNYIVDQELLDSINCINSFVSKNDISKDATNKFVNDMFNLQKNSSHLLGEEYYIIFGDLMYVLENYHIYDELREDGDSTEEDVKKAAIVALDQLNKLDHNKITSLPISLPTLINEKLKKEKTLNPEPSSFVFNLKRFLNRNNITKESIYFFIRDQQYCNYYYSYSLPKKYLTIFDDFLKFILNYKYDESLRDKNTPDEKQILKKIKEVHEKIDVMYKKDKKKWFV